MKDLFKTLPPTTTLCLLFWLILGLVIGFFSPWGVIPYMSGSMLVHFAYLGSIIQNGDGN